MSAAFFLAMPTPIRSVARLGVSAQRLSFVVLASLACHGCSSDPSLITSGEQPARGDDEGSDSDEGPAAKPGARDDEDDPGGEDDDSAEKGSEPDGVTECAAIKRDAPGKGAVDIIFLVDTSGSMLHAVTQVVTNLDAFVRGFESTPADAHVVMITGNDPAAAAGSAVATASNYLFIPSPVDSKQLFATALLHFPTYGSFLRPNAATQLVMVTDDNDLLAPTDFQAQMEELLGHEFTQHAIASENVGGLPCISEAQLWNPLCVAPIPAVCGAMAVGEAYYQLAEHTGGTQLSVCKADWTDVFGELTAAVVAAAPLPCDYSLAEASNEAYDPEQVTIVYTPEGASRDEPFPKALSPDRCEDRIGWYYDDNATPAMISLCPAACERVQHGGAIHIAFGCEPQVLL